jgi:predicted acylesterase/phospholipase RssA
VSRRERATRERRAPRLLAPLPVLALLAAGAPGCSDLRTTGAIRALSGTAAPPDHRYQATLETRIARLAKGQLADAYVDPARAGGWMLALGAAPAPLEDLQRCLVEAPGAPETEGACHGAFLREVGALVPPPGAADLYRVADANLGTAAFAQELDAERFLANGRALGAALATLERMVGRGPLPAGAVRAGLAEGARRAAAYVGARSWRRDPRRPTTAVVLSGGGANGAFSAGFVWRLLEVLQACRAPGSGCQEARLDLAAGTSTGALIALLVDMAATPGDEGRARDLLADTYGCSTNRRLYCVQSEWTWNLAVGDVKGLVRFDGVRALVRNRVPERVLGNGTERVAVSVDFQSGDVRAQSDQDPEDAAPWDVQIDAVMASIAEPVLAWPVERVGRDGRPLPGTYLDGGVRSGLPLLEAVQRGAERVLVLNNSGFEPTGVGPQRNAFQILTRTIDLLSGQTRPSEVQLAELAALQRRLLEHDVCEARLAPVVDAAARGPFCERRFAAAGRAGGPAAAAVPPFVGPVSFREVASSWRTAWVFRPEVELATSEGYSFDPRVMRPLFLLGVTTFQRRCREVLGLLSVAGPVADSACALPEPEAVARASAAFRPLEACLAGVDEQRTCP